jgi:hypothetical protein
MTEIFADYVAYLGREEMVGTAYSQTGRTTSQRTSGTINNHLAPFFGTMSPADVRRHLGKYDSKRVENAAIPTLNGEYRILRAALNLGYRSDKVGQAQLPKEYPIRLAQEDQAARTGTISDEQYTAIMSNASPLLKAVFALALKPAFVRKKSLSSGRNKLSCRTVMHASNCERVKPRTAKPATHKSTIPKWLKS